MIKIKYMVSLFIVLTMLVIPAVSKSVDNSGAIYTMTNDPAGNHVIRYDRGGSGLLTHPTYYATNGLGDPTINHVNQGALALSKNGEILLVVNAKSNDISSFKITDDSLKFINKVSSGGTSPISITIHNNLVYVLNQGGNGSIVGFHLDGGKLSMISKSSRPLSGVGTQPAEVSFNMDGNIIVVTEKGTNKIDTYVVNGDGRASMPNVQNSAGVTPYGFSFDDNEHLVVSEAVGGAVGATTVSSYSLNDKGKLKVINGAVPDFRTAACWLVVTENGIAYTNNAHDGTTSSYAVSKSGKLTLLQSVAATPGAGNVDLALSQGDKYLYSLNVGSGTVTGYTIKSDGSLQMVTNISVPTGANGLVSQ